MNTVQIMIVFFFLAAWRPAKISRTHSAAFRSHLENLEEPSNSKTFLPLPHVLSVLFRGTSDWKDILGHQVQPPALTGNHPFWRRVSSLLAHDFEANGDSDVYNCDRSAGAQGEPQPLSLCFNSLPSSCAMNQFSSKRVFLLTLMMRESDL